VRRTIAAVFACTLFLSAAVAHHSVAGEFDVHKTVTLNGVVSKVDWVNPHIYIWLDVKNAAGKIDQWHLECVPVGMARKAGLSKQMLEGHGETVSIVAFPARDGTQHLGFMTKLTFPDGHFFQFAAEGVKKTT
jgi:Family of unknown function (DUF6152)